MEELASLNARIVHQLAYEQVADRLPLGMTAEACETIRPNLKTVAEAADWWHIVEGPVEPQAEAGAVNLAEAARLQKELARVTEEVARIHKKLSNEKFVANAAPEVVAAEREKLAEYQEAQERLNVALARVRGDA